MSELSFVECINLLASIHASLGRRSRSDGNQKLDITTWQQFLVQESSAATSKKVKRYKQICLDGLLKAQNYSDENWEGSGKDLLQSEAFSLTLQDQQERSQDLLECSEKLPVDNETNAIIRFLVALKGTGGDRGKLKQGFQEMGDCIETFKRIRLDSSSSDHGSGVKAYQTKFNFKAFSSDLDPEVSGSKPYKLYTKRDFEFSKSRDSSGSFNSKSSYHVPPVFSPDNDALKQFDGSEQRDEGYSSPVPANLQSPQKKEEDIWDCVLAGHTSPIYTWEYFGQDPQAVKKQRPFASEAEGQTVHNLWKKCMESLQTVYPDMNIPVLCMVSEPTLCTHICYLLTGIQSQSFTYNKETKMFEMHPGLCIEGLSPDSLASLCQKYLEVGAIYRHIYNFLNAQREKPWSRTVVGFCAGIHKYVDLHSSSCIYIASRVQTLGKLVESVRPLVQQLDMIGSICKVRQDPQGWVQLPTGIELLSLLLQVSVHVCQEKETLILISLFKSAVEPYFRFLKRWLFSGECERSYKEFGLKMDMRYVTNRTVDYWNLTHCLAQMNDSGEATAFLADIQEKVFRTGKSLSLLKIIAPNHHLCGRFREMQPNFMLAVTNDEQNNLRISVDKYTSTVEKRTQDEAISWQQRREQQKRNEIQQAKLVIQRNNEELERLRIEKEEKEKEKRRKQKERHEEILIQMEQSKLKKEEERKKRRREEELIQEEAEKIAEEAKRREEEEMERIRQFYERLEREAEDRERRADWRLRRNNPSYKFRRMLLHKELHEDELNRLSKVKYPLNTSHGLVEEDLLSPGEGLVTEIKGVSLEADEEGNYIIVCTDSQGNRIDLGMDTLNNYESATKESTADLMEMIKSQPYLQLPIQIRTLLCEAVEDKQVEKCNKHKKRKPSTMLSPFPARKLDGVPHILNQRKSSIADYLYQDGYTTEYPDKNGNMSGTDDGVDSPNSPTAKSRRHSQQIERILYPQRYFTSEAEKIEFKKTDINLKITGKPLPYTKSFPELKQPSKQEIDTALPVLETTTFPPLSLILQNSILVPLRAQQKLVDAALLSQLLVDYKLEDHLIALRRYLFLADGEFGRQLVISMCMLGKELNPAAELAGELHQHLVENAPVPALLCPGSLNRVLEAAIAASQEGAHDPLAWNLTFALKDKSDYNLCIPGLSLGYRVSWPCNILLTQEVLAKYSSVLEFMVNIRTCLVSLELDWGHQNLVLRHQRKSTNFQQHRLNIMRHEMLNFVRNLHSYVTSQVLEVSWIEFQENLHNKVTNLDELILWHNKYMNRVLFRCLLNQKAAPVMKFIKMIFQAINKFTSLICVWREPGDQHLWEQILKQYAAFERTSKFFFNLVTKLMVRGYDTHFQDLLTRLNLNGYYTTSLDNSSSLSVISSGSISSTTINSLP